MNFFAHLLIVLLTVSGMEAWAWFSHKYILHGPLWFLHRSHHRPRRSWWEWNDTVSVLYGIIAAILIIRGAEESSWHLSVGIGIALYGIFYFIFHDIIIHQRIKWKHRFRHPYVKRLIWAHKQHHRHGEKNPGEAYGFLYADKKYQIK